MNKILRLDSMDNVAVALTDLNPSELVASGSVVLEVKEPVAVMHKVAVVPIPKGARIIKFGQTIGVASTDIARGCHIHHHNCVVDEHREAVPGAIAPSDRLKPQAAQEQRSFMGFVRPDGRVGTRNYVGVITSVNCSATVARQIAAHYSMPGALHKFPNVDGVIALTHESGCGMRSSGEGYDTLARTLEGYIRHPNFGGLLMVGLGCETMQVSAFLERTGLETNKSFSSFNIQGVGGTKAAISEGISRLQLLLPEANRASREPCSASHLALAVQCGGSDAFSGITANPALGIASDLLVEQGGNVIYSETPEIFGAEHLLKARAVAPHIAQKLTQRIDWWQQYTRANGFEMNNNPSPGNKEGGLSTILEKSLGAQAKGGTSPLTDVLLYGEPIKTKGLVFMDSPGYDPVSVTGQVASGANVICFTTGRGSAFGFKPVPSLKLSSNTRIYQHMKDDIDINCGAVIDGNQTLQQVGRSIFERILAVASGEPSKSEALGYGDAEFCPWKIGAVV